MRRTSHVVLLAVMVAGGCNKPSLVARRPANVVVDDAVTQLWTREVGQVARTGDWILTRSMSFSSDIITWASGGRFSHISIYDAESGTVIEATGPRVREVTLENLMGRQYEAMVVRPRGFDETALRDAVDRARTVVGADFDYGGLLGFDDPDSLYCSELLLWSNGYYARGEELELVVSPDAMARFGDIVFYSGTRGEPAMQALALRERFLPSGGHVTRTAHASQATRGDGKSAH